MKKLIISLLAVALLFTACGDKSEPKTEESVFVTDLVQLVGKTNGEFKELYDGPCYADSSAYRTKGWMTTDSSINVVFEDYGKWIWNNTNAST